MPLEYRNIYKTARNAAGITQERAAELLNVSVESLRVYEGNGKRLPPDDVVATMCAIYDAQYLACQHLSRASELGARVIPEIVPLQLSQAASRFVAALNRAYGLSGTLLEIAWDNEITPDQENDYRECMSAMRECLAAGMSLECAPKNQKGVS